MGMITDHLRDEPCEMCGKVEPLTTVYVFQADETMHLCDDCQPEEDPRR